MNTYEIIHFFTCFDNSTRLISSIILCVLLWAPNILPNRISVHMRDLKEERRQ